MSEPISPFSGKPLFIVDPAQVHWPDIIDGPPYSERLQGYICRTRKSDWCKGPPIRLVFTTEDTAELAYRLEEAETLLSMILADESGISYIPDIKEYFAGITKEEKEES